MTSRSLKAFLVATIALSAFAPVQTSARLAPLAHDRGAAGLQLALRKLPVSFNVLYVTAHPDDENNGVLVMLSRGKGIRTGLFTLTRGDGGQNEIGPELFQAIGILRTEELAGVHRYDGAEQFFSNAYEFGYSFSVEETFDKWGKEATLEDVVRVFRAFRPDVVLTLPLEAPGGGQHHQASARLALEAFRVAADASRFPSAGTPWQAARVYQGGTGGGMPGERVEGGAPPVAVMTNVYDPALGMSWAEFGSIARTAHKCQGTSQLASEPGDGRAQFLLLDSEPKLAASETFLPNDLSVRALARFAPGHEAAAPFLAPGLAAIEGAANAAVAAFDPLSLSKPAPHLARGLSATRDLLARIRSSSLDAGAKTTLAQRLAKKEREFEDALVLAHGLVVQAVSNDGDVTRGQTFDVRALVVNQGGTALAFDGVALETPEGSQVAGGIEKPGDLAAGQKTQGVFKVTMAGSARFTQPYWRKNPKTDRYDLDVPSDFSRPWSPADVRARFSFRSDGVAFSTTVPAIHRYEGRWVGGEKQKEVNVIPALSVSVSPGLVVAPKSATAVRRELRVAVRNGRRGPVSALARIVVADARLKVEPASAPLSFAFEGEEITTRFFVTTPAGAPEGEFELKAVVSADGEEFSEGFQTIAYDHIQERHLFHPAVARLRVQQVAVSRQANVGYVVGVGDEIPDAIRQLGAPLSFIASDELAYGDLSKYTTIVLGVRAFLVRNDLKENYARVMKYVEAGGNLVVMYNKFEFNFLAPPVFGAGGFSGGGARAAAVSPFAPYPASVTSNRVSVEETPVRILEPSSALLTAPNRIGDTDFEGWVQERGLYFFGANDPKYRDLLASTDPWPKNPGEKKGLLVEVNVGKGTWTYVGLGLFRQLPAGTKGAYRILANLVSRPRGAGAPAPAKAAAR